MQTLIITHIEEEEEEKNNFSQLGSFPYNFLQFIMKRRDSAVSFPCHRRLSDTQLRR